MAFSSLTKAGADIHPSQTPVHFAPEVVEALQASTETDSTRSKDLELHIQNRVAAELKRLDESTSKDLADLKGRVSAEGPASSPDEKSKGEDKAKDLGRQSVQKEIDVLKARLQSRKEREDVVNDKVVDRAKEDVIKCLRTNDRRPLDCWREVEVFKAEVGRLEKDFLGRVME